MANVAIMGYGTVGSGVYEILKTNSKSITRRARGEEINIKRILDIRDFPEHPEKELFTKDFDDILHDDSIEVIVEVMGGLHPAYEFTKALLEAGKSVVTSNKELVATHGTELLEIAVNKNCNYLFEASVGGGIPIIRPMHQCLTANNIQRITGILNGTTNFILNEMIKNGSTFEEALADAQSRGYAERNPAADIEGHDACRKIAILASLASGVFVDYNDIKTEGITNITLDDVRYARSIGGVVKLIGYAEFMEDAKIYSVVCPMIVENTSPLAGVDGVFNAIMVTGDYVGDVMFYGKGAGKLPTASAVVADVIDEVNHLERSKRIQWVKAQENVMASPDDKKFRYFVRTNRGAVTVKSLFEGCRFVESIVAGEIAFVTAPLSPSERDEKFKELGSVVSSLRILE